MNVKKLLLVIFLVLVVVGVVWYVYDYKFNSSDGEVIAGGDIGVDSVLLKTVLREGGTYNARLKIENMKDYGRHFDVVFQEIDDLASAYPESFALAAGEEKFLEIEFSNSNNLSEGVYVGSMNVLSEESSRSIPIVLEIESKDVLFDSNVEVYPSGSIKPGDKINADIRIFDLSKIGASNVEIEYFIKDFSDELIVFESETVVVKDTISISKPLVLSDRLRHGDYVFGVLIKYKDSYGTSSTYFRIGDGENDSEFPIDTNTLYFIAFASFTLLILVIFIFYSIYSRDRLVDELKEQYRSELRRQSVLIRSREAESEKVFKTSGEKKVARKIFKKVEKERKKVLGTMHKNRMQEFRKLKKAKTKDQLKNQIEKWKKSGYDTSVLERKIKVPSINELKSQIAGWKKKGFNTKVLEKNLRNRKV
jgi:hypothetical protein